MNHTGPLPKSLAPLSPYSEELVTKLLPFSVRKTYPPRRKMIISSEDVHFCYLIEKGRFQLHRQDDDLIVGFWKGPAILGIGNFNKMYMGSYIKTLTTCEIGIIPTKEALEIIERENLWRTLSEHLLIISGKFYDLYLQLSAPTAYDIIRIQIMELMCEEAVIRDATTIETYIRDKTHLSRSGVMKILMSLKQGGYIEMERGKLISVLSPLPKKY